MPLFCRKQSTEALYKTNNGITLDENKYYFGKLEFYPVGNFKRIINVQFYCAISNR